MQLRVGRLEPRDEGGHEGVELRLAHRAAVLQGAQHHRGEAVRQAAAVVVQLAVIPQGCQMAKFDPPTPSTLAQSKERKGSNFAA